MTVAVDLIAPLVAARANGHGLAIRPAPLPADATGWLSAGTFARDRELLAEALERTARAAGTASRAVAATWLLEKHAWHVASAALAAVLVHGAVPPLDGALVQLGEHGWADAIALPPDDWEPAGGRVLAARLAAHHGPLVEALAPYRSRRALWRSVGDRLGQAALWCGEAFDDHRRAWAIAAEALTAVTALAAPAGFELLDGAPFRRRTGCCLSHRCPDGRVCDDCPLRS